MRDRLKTYTAYSIASVIVWIVLIAIGAATGKTKWSGDGLRTGRAPEQISAFVFRKRALARSKTHENAPPYG